MVSKSLPEINIGLIGHVDHGKTTLVSAISGKWTAVHSEEIKRGITIRLGYADASVYKCAKCSKYTTKEMCDCGGKATFQRKISFVDAPGHETLMAIMVSGAAIMDAAILLVAANEECPQPQTREHLLALKVLGIKNLLVIQNKVDLVSKSEAQKQYETVKTFIKSELGFEPPILPVSSAKRVNINYVLEAIQELFPTPQRSLGVDPVMLAVRSFDVNKPGTAISKLAGGVVGGAIIRGEFEKGKEIEIQPGLRVMEKNQTVWKPIVTKINSIVSGNAFVDKKGAGGLVAFSTEMDSAITKGDSLSGNVITYKGRGWPVHSDLKLKISLFEKVVGMKTEADVIPLKVGEAIMINSGTTTTLGVVRKPGQTAELALKKPICADVTSKVALSRNFGGRWRLIGIGEILG